ncbi:hypothetical protein D918_09185 [Trichuris suis]|nr:hypothetical protein D918_09185 [Trichuris suis]
MYMHRLGDKAARFTDEDMEQGRHLEYQQKLIKAYLSQLEECQSSHKPIVSFSEATEGRSAWGNPEGNVPFVADQRAGDDPTSSKENLKVPVEPVELKTFTTKGDASSWDDKNDETVKATPDDVIGLSMHLSPFCLPVYGQTMVDDPRQPVIHIGHGHNEHNLCTCQAHFCEGNVLSSLDYSLRRALDASLKEEDHALNSSFSCVNPSGYHPLVTRINSTNNRAEMNCYGECVPPRHRSHSERFCDVSPRQSNESLRSLLSEHPLYLNLSGGNSPIGLIGGSPSNVHSLWHEMHERCLSQEDGRPHSFRSGYDWPPDERSISQAHSCFGGGSVGYGVYKNCQHTGTGSLPTSFQASRFGGDYDPYLKLQQYHEPSSSSFRSGSPWM